MAAILKFILWRTGSQCNSDRTGVIWSKRDFWATQGTSPTSRVSMWCRLDPCNPISVIEGVLSWRENWRVTESGRRNRWSGDGARSDQHWFCTKDREPQQNRPRIHKVICEACKVSKKVSNGFNKPFNKRRGLTSRNKNINKIYRQDCQTVQENSSNI